MIYCRDYFGFDSCILSDRMDPNDNKLSWFPPDYYISVPCGKCAECRKNKRNGWVIRLLKEIHSHSSSTFVTLTLDDEYLAKFNGDPKKPLKLYIDRLRKALGFRPRYFFVDELGDASHHSGRLHYHGIIFGTTEHNIRYAMQRQKWKYGFVWLEPCDDKKAHYVTKYILKPQQNFKQFILCSNGIGAGYVTDAIKEFHLNNFDPIFCVTRNGFKYPLPPYYRSKIFTDEIKAVFTINRLNETSFERVFRGHTFTDEFSYKNALNSFYQWTIEHNLSVVDKLIDKHLYNFNPYENGTICFSESRACRYSAFQTRFKFV